MKIEKSNRHGKRFVATFSNGLRVHFGSAGGQTYIDHGDADKRAAYLARHGANRTENWYNPRTAGALSRWLLWGNHKSLAMNKAAFEQRFVG